MRVAVVFVVVLSVATTFCLVSCFRSQEQQPAQQSDSSAAAVAVKTAPLRAIFPASRTLDTVISADVLGSGIPKTFVFSVTKDTAHPVPSFAQFDLMQTYNWSVGDSSWKIAGVDPFAYGTEVRVQDITRDGKPDLVIYTHTDSLGASDGDGLAIWSAHGGEWKLIFKALTGDPTLQDVDNDSLPEIILHGYYAGVLPNTEAVEYISDIYGFDGTRYSEAKNRYPNFFSDLVAQAKQQYAQAKTQTPVSAPITDEVNFTLYKPCLQALAVLHTSGDTSGARAFWNSEKEYLSRMIPQEQFIDLQSFVETN